MSSSARFVFPALAVALALSLSCHRPPANGASSPPVHASRRIVDTRVTFQFPAYRAHAELTVGAGSGGGGGDEEVVLDVGVAEARAALDERSTKIERVARASPSAGGAPIALRFALRDVEDASAHVFRRQLVIALDAAALIEKSPVLLVDYVFVEQPRHHDGVHKGFADGRTSTWPFFCGNVFPCQPAPDADATFHLVAGVTGFAGGVGTDLPMPIPPYAAAFAVGPLRREWLGVTHAGTTLDLFGPNRGPDRPELPLHLASLVPAFAWMERNVGPWSFGESAGAVVVASTGGMEHLPFWHVGDDRTGDATVAVHEAIHGWFGNGVRLRCFEDFVLSEGTTEYLTARVLREVGDPAGDALALADERELEAALERGDLERRAWRPETCGAFDVDRHYSVIPYVKGELFYAAVERRIGFARLVGVLHDFYVAHRLRASSMREMIDALVAAAPEIDVEGCATKWLREDALPTDRDCAAKP